MTDLLDPAVHAWLPLLSPEDLAGMRQDLADGPDPLHCSHGTPIDEAIGRWAYFALDEIPPPADWTAFDPRDQLWFAYLGGGDAVQCRSDFAVATTDEEREHLYYGWRSSGAIAADPVLTARLRDRDDSDPL